jgi:predicted HNH restriction endonuclease
LLTDNAKGIRADKLTPEDTGLYEDFQAIEGATKETRLRLAQRDRHLAITLKRIGPLKCQICCYDPKQHGANDRQAHAIIGVHHKKPLQAGNRLSTLKDHLLLCPTCHREVHQGIAQISHGA